MNEDKKFDTEKSEQNSSPWSSQDKKFNPEELQKIFSFASGNLKYLNVPHLEFQLVQEDKICLL